MRLRNFFVLVLVFVLPLLAVSAYADELGTALDPFAVLAGTAVTNASSGGAAATIINGSVGVWPGTSITGLPPMIVVGTVENDTAAAMAAQAGLTSAFTTLSGLTVPAPNVLGAGGLIGATLTPGVYSVASQAFDLTTGSTLTLTGTGQFVFLMSSTLTLGTDVTINTSALGAGSSLYWVAPSTGTAVTLGPNADAEGNFLASGAIVFDPGATVGCGRALSENGLVSFAGQGTVAEPSEGSLDANQVGGGCTGNLANSGGLNGGGPGPGPVPAPEPGTLALLSSGLLAMAFLAFRKSRVSSPSLSC
jgi:type VI secretion system secreted protein VgrG